MEIRVVENGLPVEQVADLLTMGWMVIPGVAVSTGSTIAVPGQPPPGMVRVDLWILPEPAIPQQALFAVLMQGVNMGGDQMTLDWICKRLLGGTLHEVQQALMRRMGPEEAPPSPEEELLDLSDESPEPDEVLH